MITKSQFSRVAMAVALSVGVATTAVANTGQSSAMRGMIVGPQGNPAAGSTITILHQPSGTVKEAEVNAEGAFSARGLRVGGPYTIIVESDKFQSQVIEDVYLDLNDTFQLNAQLEGVSDVERIVVTGTRDFFSNSGANSVFGEDFINNTATFNRDLKDVVRNNPLAAVSPDGDELSVAGSNPKYNAVTIDGVGINDTFGLQSNGYPTSRPPISLDAVEQVSIEYAPFNTRAGKFGGGNINVVTKSGTNEVSGSVFFETVPTTGDAIDDRVPPGDDPIEFPTTNEEESYGFTLGAPLIEDKLFFFGSYEKWEEDVVLDFDPSTYSAEALADANAVIDILANQYGITDTIGGAPSPNEDEKILIKLDWNISNNHRADFTYSNQESSQARNFNDSPYDILLTSNQWTSEQTNEFYTAHVYSDWSADFFTEVSMSYKEFEQASVTKNGYGTINVRGEEVDVTAGQDQFRHANVLANEVFNFGVHATYLSGDVEYKFGFEMEDTTNYNLFAEGSDGVWDFDSIEDFAAGQIAEFYYSNAYTNNEQDVAYDVDSTTYALYGDATFDLTDDIVMTAGLRYEYLSVDQAPALNQNFLDTYGFANTENLDGFDIILPRVSFDWTVTDDLTVRGGLGRYTGGTPLVWISNAYTNDGVTLDSVTLDSLDPSDVDFTSVPQVAMDALAQGAGSTNQIDPDFEMPSDWRYQIGADYIFDIPGVGEDFAWTTELTYVDREDSVYWVDLSRVDNGNRTADGQRIIWDNVYNGTAYEDNFDIQLTNSDDGGRSVILTTALNKEWDNGFSFNASYTNQDITEANPGTSSRAVSNYQYEVTLNRNNPLVGTAYYEVEHRFVLNLGYKTEFFEGYTTNFNLFFERRSGRPFSWTLGSFRDDDFGDQPALDDSDIYIPYIPSGADDPNMDFESGLSYDEIMAIASEAGVAGAAGGYVEKYSATQPWFATADLYISQEVPGFVDGHKGKVYLTISNFANLLNDDWGKVYRMRFPQQILFDFDVNDQGQYIYQERFGGTNTANYDTFDVSESTWRLKVGVKYTF
ncbi:TonB-dependent receptor [Alteromonas sp. H39]|uniref:TonB-dependent receptor n=1 Tax=Alteromonas sp. H39 TaxID=3389876 RepID=UPI0039E1BEC4